MVSIPPCSPSSRPDFNETLPDLNPMLRQAPPPSPSPVGRENLPCMGLTMFNLFEVVPEVTKRHFFEVLT
jgi:hypothetical protein